MADATEKWPQPEIEPKTALVNFFHKATPRFSKRRTNVRIIRMIGVALAAAGILMVGNQFRGIQAKFVPVVQAAQNGCSNNSLRGNYGFQIRGTIVGFGPIVGTNIDVGHVTDYQGELAIAVNPKNPLQLVGGANTFFADPKCPVPKGINEGTMAAYGSKDGGLTWTYNCTPWPA